MVLNASIGITITLYKTLIFKNNFNKLRMLQHFDQLLFTLAIVSLFAPGNIYCRYCIFDIRHRNSYYFFSRYCLITFT